MIESRARERGYGMQALLPLELVLYMGRYIEVVLRCPGKLWLDGPQFRIYIRVIPTNRLVKSWNDVFVFVNWLTGVRNSLVGM